MGLRFDPIGGGQFKQAVKQIIEAESQPIKQLEARKANEDSRLKLFQDFKGKFSGLEKTLSDLATFKKFRELKVDLGDGQTLMGVTIDKDKAASGSYLMEIDQLANKTSVMSNGFDDPDEPVVGMGFIVMKTLKGDSMEIFIDDDQSSLRGIANAINNEPDSMVRAAVIRDASETDEPWKMIITGKKGGAENQLAFPDFYFLDGGKDFYIDDDHESRNAIVQLDGFSFELDNNDVVDFLPGVNVHLRQARPDQPFTLTITEDYQKISGKIKALVEQINGVLQFIYKQNAIDEHSNTRNTFAGDTGLQTIEYRLRNLMHEGFPAGDEEKGTFHLVFLNQLGIEFEKSGQMAFKEEKFVKSMEKDFEGISQAITGEFGFAFQLNELLKGYTTPMTGMLSLREKGLQSRIKEIDNQIDVKQRALDQRQQHLVEQFSRLEASLANLQRQQQYLSASLPNAGGGGGNLVAQLLGG